MAVGRMAGHREIQVAEGLVRHTHILSCAYGHHLLIRQCLGLLVLPLEDKLTHLRQVFLRLRMNHLIGLSCPEGLFIELDMLHSRRTEDHAADDTIAHRQCLRPSLSRLVVPQTVLRLCKGIMRNE